MTDPKPRGDLIGIDRTREILGNMSRSEYYRRKEEPGFPRTFYLGNKPLHDDADVYAYRDQCLRTEPPRKAAS
jgi:hypothetical protein